MNDHRPTRWPCSADSSRNAGCSGVAPRSLRNAETGVSQSSMNVWRSGMRLWAPASARASSSDGLTGSAGASATAANEDLLGVGQRAPTAVEQHGQVVEDVGGLLVDAVVALVAGGAGDLLGLLPHLGADARRVVEQLDGVGPGRAVAGALVERALQAGQRLVRRGRLHVAAEEARPRAGVARGARGLDERQQRVAVAVQAQRADLLDVAARGALVPG